MSRSEKEQSNLLQWDGAKAGFYEVYYLKWNDAKSQTAAWIRYTLTSPTDQKVPPYCELWGIFFDAKSTEKCFAVKNRFPITKFSWAKDYFDLRIDQAVLTMDECKGGIEDKKTGHALSWDLKLDSLGAPYRYFPSEWFYKGPFPKTKGISPHYDGRFSGRIIANGRKIDFKDAPAQQTHLWGVKHAKRWAWGHCNAFAEDPALVWELLDAQIKVGPFTSPHFVNGALRFQGRDYMFNAPADWLRNKSAWDLGRWDFTMKNDELMVNGRIQCDYDKLVTVTYTDPDGELLWCNNSKIADIEIRISDAQGQKLGEFHSEKACAAEFVDRIIYPQSPVRI